MIAELGHLALVLALATALYQTSVPLYGAAAGDLRLMQAAVPAALTQLALIAFAFAALTWSYVSSDFSLAQCVCQFPFRQAADLQDLRRVGKS